MTLDQDGKDDYRQAVSQADNGYKHIVPFSTWASVSVDHARWESYVRLLHELGSEDPIRLTRARNVAKRAAAIDTGAIENLYELDRGITITIAAQTAMWEAAFQKEEARTRSLIECQLTSYDYILDFATNKIPIAEAWIRDLHARICSAQPTFKALTPQGYQEQHLRHGEYKTLPNHVRLRDGGFHSYAPVALTGPEMCRFCKELRTPEFELAHPIVQAAYSHHAFACIHPFQDGNGRVARALASVFLYRGASIPLFILVSHRDEYFDCLESADAGNYQRFADFIFERCMDAFLLVAESLRSADIDDPLTTFKRLQAQYVTKGGYQHHEVDLAGQKFLHALHTELEKQAIPLRVPNQIAIQIDRTTHGNTNPPAGMRNPVTVSNEALILVARSSGPAQAEVRRTLFFYLPKDCDRDDPIIICSPESKHQYTVPITKIMEVNRSVLDLQVAMFAHRALGEVSAELERQAMAYMKSQGY